MGNLQLPGIYPGELFPVGISPAQLIAALAVRSCLQALYLLYAAALALVEEVVGVWGERVLRRVVSRRGH
jgi:hypothetical protein